MPVKNQTAEELASEAQTIIGHVKNANAMAEKLKAQLKSTREVLELVKKYQHPKIDINLKFSQIGGKAETATPEQVIYWEIERINALLGDRA